MINVSEQCLQYTVSSPEPTYDECPFCHKIAMAWVQGKTGTFHLECSKCGEIIAVDLNTPCESDPMFYQPVHISIKPVTEKHEKDYLLRISKHLHLSAIQTRKELMNGCTLDVDIGNLVPLIEALRQLNIEYQLNIDDPCEKYASYKECKYPYSKMRQIISKS